ncbi:hypothetical protein B0H67DRAFT_649298 [Lasiosphaeris hirsuta]|uniref:Uncharacterized protein n=1 Tax=Lasiosphaeris hirsuta TaxID=260670 RepID=A0AA40DKS6_9PEZI|nr:hypothetical protein B0H67DRAFT_649298 [Lasiosphaeris hirsuta]
MRHQLRRVIEKNISHHSTEATLDHALRALRGHDGSILPIQNPDVLAMREDYFAVAQKDRRELLGNLDARIADKNAYSVDSIREAKRATAQEEEYFKQYKHHHYIKRWGLLFESDGKDEEWFIASPTVLDESDPEYLCDMCRHIDFEALLTRRGLPGNRTPGSTTIQVRGLPMVMKGVYCAFCSLLRPTLVAAYQDSQLDEGAIADKTLMYLNVIDEGPSYALRLEVEFGDIDESYPRVVVQRLVSEADVKPLQGLPVDQGTANMERLSGWLRKCEEEHPKLDSTPHQSVSTKQSSTLFR